MKFRISQWLDTSDMDVNELPVVYGIQVNKGDGLGWHHLAIDGEAAIYGTMQEADDKLKELRRQYGDAAESFDYIRQHRKDRRAEDMG